MQRFAAVLSLVLLFSSSAWAQGCYTPREVEAEQAIRIHSELMVIGLTCMNMPQGPVMYQKYERFTQKNHVLLAAYEEDLITYYRNAGYANPEKQIHTLRTNLANQISQHAITMSISTFCQTFGPRVDKALQMDQQKIRRWAQHSFSGSPTSQPMCSRSQVAAKY
jgi:hypothetical protein